MLLSIKSPLRSWKRIDHYPSLGRIGERVVILFDSEGCGTVVWCENPALYRVGYHDKSWNMDEVELHLGTISLTESGKP